MEDTVSLGFSWQFLFWAASLGCLSAVSLPLGSLVGIFTKPTRSVTAIMGAFGGGALLAALALELVAPTTLSLTQEDASGHGGLAAFFALLIGAVIGGSLFVFLDQIVNAKGGFLRKVGLTVSHFSLRKAERTRELLNDLSKMELLRHVPQNLISELVANVHPRHFLPEETVFNEGDLGEEVFFIKSGSVDVFHDGECVAQLGAGEVVGEIALLTSAPRTATVKASSEVGVLALSKKDFDWLRKSSSDLDQIANELAASRLSELAEKRRARTQSEEQWVDDAVEALKFRQEVPTAADLRQMSEEHHGAPLAIWLGIMLDGIPESVVIGVSFLATMAAQTNAGAVGFLDVIPYTLIAGLFLSNFPEAMSSSVGMKAQEMKPLKIFGLWFSLAILTSIGAASGYLLGGYISHVVLVGIEGLAAGAMLTMIAGAMLPEASHLGGGTLTGISTLAGFLSVVAFKLLEIA